MSIFKKIYDYLIAKYRAKNNCLTKTEDTNIKGSITFNLYKNSSIDIFCYIPETRSMDSNKLTEEAENFGNFISHITDGLVSDAIIKILDKTKKETKEINERLFIENILFFWAMTHVNRQNEKEKKIASKPVIKPTAVFAQTKPYID